MKYFLSFFSIAATISLFSCTSCSESNLDNSTQDSATTSDTGTGDIIDLPPPRLESDVSLEEVLQARYSLRKYSDEPLPLEDISQLLWSAQGITHGDKKKTAPSAGQTYPMEVYLATPDAFYHYLPQTHQVAVLSKENLIAPLADIGESFVAKAPAVFILTAVFARTEQKYGDRAERYVKLEAGHVGQNILLQAVALEMGGCVVGAFKDNEIATIFNLPDDNAPLYLIPVGHPEE
ncbi:MAG: SagB/ThcOx family dehydrogenase [Myxococcota bacterium]|nr:SagB/ThcOx family dehydrogenase [Myxococcota bacterium]